MISALDNSKTELQVNPRTRRIHLALVSALRRIDETCSELGVSYWLDGGTLLGAVRHHGPIPWDDDVDFRHVALRPTPIR